MSEQDTGGPAPEDRMARYVKVYGPRPEAFGGTGLPAVVSWSAIGSVTPDDARQFAAALLAAADKADSMNGATLAHEGRGNA